MRNRLSDKSDNIHQNEMIEKALKTGGFLFPETVAEVKEFERLFGTTDVILPAELEDSAFLYSKSGKKSNSKIVEFPCDNFAMAARDGSSELPIEIQQQIISDIEKAELKKKGKKK